MNRTIVLNWKNSETPLEKEIRGRDFFYAGDQKEAYLNHMEKGEVDSYVIDCREIAPEKVKIFIRHIRYLNGIISIILYKGDREKLALLAAENNIHLAEGASEVGKILKNASQTKRAWNRIEWPLRASYWTENSSSLNRPEALVTSISSGGCFFKPVKGFGGDLGDEISILFHFRNFDFLTDGVIVRVDRDRNEELNGIATQFKDVSPQTASYIQEIIDEKILSEIMQLIK